jgi:hypothetical protein
MQGFSFASSQVTSGIRNRSSQLSRLRFRAYVSHARKAGALNTLR